MVKYAANTKVSKGASLIEIQALLEKYGASKFALRTETQQAMVAFKMSDRRVKFTVSLPDPKSRVFTHTPSRGSLRTEKAAQDAYQQAVRQHYRVLLSD